jgi:hypothetical protein
MGEYAIYRAVDAEVLQEALTGPDPKQAVFDLAFGADANGYEVDLANAHEPLAYVLAGPDGDHFDFDDVLVSAVTGHTQVGTDAPAVNSLDRVVVIDRALSSFDRDTIAQNFDPAAMDDDGVDPGGFEADPGWLDTLYESFDELRKLYALAAQNGWAVVVDIG